MLFRIEDSENEDGVHREYSILPQDLPTMPMSGIEVYIADEIRKEVNGANNRRLLSYSKSLGICLLKYNKYADNEINLNGESVFDYIAYYECKSQKAGFEVYSLDYVLMDLGIEKKNKEVILTNFVIDVSDNKLFDSYFIKIYRSR